jgi:anthranilate phosphoribosyltransferase
VTSDSILGLIGRVTAGEHLTRDEACDALESIIDGRLSAGEIAIFLTSLAAKGETAEEVAGATIALRRHMVPVRCGRVDLVDTCGTGGDRMRTFNISTAAALVTAASGVAVAKHGNRRVTSSTGSADVLAELGVRIDAPLERVESCLEELGIGFCFAPLLHPAMARVAQVRRELGIPTIFNLLGPLSNPASAPFQVLGVGRAALRPLLAGALAQLGTSRALVVHGCDGLDEITLAGPTGVTQVEGRNVREMEWAPEDFGVRRGTLDEIKVENVADSAVMIRKVLAGHKGAARDIVILNAAAALYAAGKTFDLREAAALAADAIDRAAAAELLERLVERTRG